MGVTAGLSMALWKTVQEAYSNAYQVIAWLGKVGKVPLITDQAKAPTRSSPR